MSFVQPHSVMHKFYVQTAGFLSDISLPTQTGRAQTLRRGKVLWEKCLKHKEEQKGHSKTNTEK